jgi:hypothetical protein
VLSTDFAPWGGIAQDASTIYFVSADGKLKSVPKAGGVTSTIAGGLLTPVGVAVDATSAYVTEYIGNQVTRIALATGAREVLATAQGRPEAIAVGGGYVYWTTYGTGAANGTLMRCATSGCAQTPTALATRLQLTAADSFGPMTNLVLDATSVYWSDGSGSGQVRAAPLAGGNAVQLIGALGFSLGLALSRDTLAVTVLGSSGQVLTGPTTGGSSLLAGNQPFAVSVAMVDNDVYWTLWNPSAANGEQVRKCSIGGKPQVLARGVQPAGGVVADANSVYWLSNDGTVLKTAR